MKILPISFIRLNNSNTTHKESNYKLTDKTLTDSICFSASKNYFQNEKENLDNLLKNEIIPFIEEAKEPLTQIGFIGYNAQNKLEIFNKEEENFMKKKYLLPPSTENKNYKLIISIINKYDDYQINKKRFEHLSRQGESALLNTLEISETINKTKPLFSEVLPEERNIQELKNYTEKINSALFQESENITLQKNYPELFEKKQQLDEQRIKAVYYLLKTPLKDALELKTQIQQLTIEQQKPIELQNKIDSLKEKISNLNKEKLDFYKNQNEIKTFASQNQHTIMPTNNQIKNAYKVMNKSYDDLLKKHLDKSERYFQNKFDINSAKNTIQKLDEAIEKQNTAINQLENLIHKSKQEYIKKYFNE